MKQKLKKVKKGEFITLREIEEPKPNQVWIRGHYCRDIDRYEIYNFANGNERFLNGKREVFTDFCF